MVDSAIYEAVLAMMESLLPEWSVAGYQRERTGAILPNVAPSNVYPTADGDDILIAANQDTVFRRLAEILGRPELADDPRYASHARAAPTRPSSTRSSPRGPPPTPPRPARSAARRRGSGRSIYTAADLLADPHVAAREAIVRVPHERFGELPMQAPVPKLSATPGAVNWSGPELGQHNDEVYGDLLGMSAEQRAALRADGVI